MEQYGYTEEYYDKKPKSGPIVRMLKILVLIIIISVFAVIFFRIWSQETYPDEMEELAFNEALTALYEEQGKNMSIFTQTIRIPYDDSKEGNFFSHALFLIPDANQVQITVRYSQSTMQELKELYGESAVSGEMPFRFVLCDNRGNTYPLTNVQSKKRLMYFYNKLIFDGVDFPLPKELGLAEGTPAKDATGYYMTVNIYLQNGDEPIARLPIYETHLQTNNDDGIPCLYTYHIEEYRPDKGEWPQ